MAGPLVQLSNACRLYSSTFSSVQSSRGAFCSRFAVAHASPKHRTPGSIGLLSMSLVRWLSQPSVTVQSPMLKDQERPLNKVS